MSRKNELDLQIKMLFEDGKRNFDDCDDADKEFLTGMVMQKCKCRDRFDFISQTDVADVVADMLMNLLVDPMPDPDQKRELIEVMKNGAIESARKTINEMFRYEAEMEALRNPSREPSELEIMVANHVREVSQELNRLNYSY